MPVCKPEDQKGGEAVARAEKVAVVNELADKLQRGQSVVLTDYRGLNVKSMTELRAKLREVGVEYKVVKNTLTLRAAQQIELEGLDELLVGPTAIAIGYDDPVSAAKVLTEFAKSNNALEVKGGVLEGRVIGVDEINALADLPSREELLAQVLRGMQSPIAGFAAVLQGTINKLVYVLEAVRKEKEGAA